MIAEKLAYGLEKLKARADVLEFKVSIDGVGSVMVARSWNAPRWRIAYYHSTVPLGSKGASELILTAVKLSWRCERMPVLFNVTGLGLGSHLEVEAWMSEMGFTPRDGSASYVCTPRKAKVKRSSSPEKLVRIPGIHRPALSKAQREWLLTFETPNALVYCRPEFHAVKGVWAHGLIVRVEGSAGCDALGNHRYRLTEAGTHELARLKHEERVKSQNESKQTR